MADFVLLGSIDEPNIDFHVGVDDGNDLAWYFRVDDSTPNYDLVCADISDQSNPVVADKLDSTEVGTQETELQRMFVDPENQRLVISKTLGSDDAGEGLWLISYDSQGQMTVEDTLDFEALSITDSLINPNFMDGYHENRTFVLDSTAANSTLYAADYQGDTLSVNDSTTVSGDDMVPAVDQSRGIAWVISKSGKAIHVLDMKDDPFSVLHTETTSWQPDGRPAVDESRDLCFVADSNSADFYVLKWDGSFSEVGSSTTHSSFQSNLAYNDSINEVHGTGGQNFIRWDVSDPENPSEVGTAQSTWPSSSLELDPRWTYHYQNGERLVLTNFGSGDAYFATVDTELTATAATIRLTWNERCGRNDTYRLQRRNVTQGTAFSDIATPDASRPLEHEDRVTTLNEVYEYRIRAENDQGQSPWSNLAQVKPT